TRATKIILSKTAVVGTEGGAIGDRWRKSLDRCHSNFPEAACESHSLRSLRSSRPSPLPGLRASHGHGRASQGCARSKRAPEVARRVEAGVAMNPDWRLRFASAVAFALFAAPLMLIAQPGA